MSKPIYERYLYIGSGLPIASFLSLEPQDEEDEPVGYLTDETTPEEL